MKRYLLFTGLDYYPAQGWVGMRGDYDTEDEAVKEGRRVTHPDFEPKSMNEYHHDWWHVVDTHTGRICIHGREGKVTEPEGLPEHLKYDADYLVCSGCGRHTWGDYEGSECRMTQPFGNVCGGTFEKP